MNRVVVIIERGYEPDDEPMLARGEVRVEAVFYSSDFTRDAVLDVFEDALRAAGYHCPIDALDVHPEAEKL